MAKKKQTKKQIEAQERLEQAEAALKVSPFTLSVQDEHAQALKAVEEANE